MALLTAAKVLRRCGITFGIVGCRIGSIEVSSRFHHALDRTQIWFNRIGRFTVSHERRCGSLQGFRLLAAALACLTFATRWLCRMIRMVAPPCRECLWWRSRFIGVLLSVQTGRDGDG